MKVRCLSCGWDGDRKTDLPLNSEHPRPCPDCQAAVLVGPWLPTSSETTPSGIQIDFWDETRAEFPEATQRRRYLVNGEKFKSVTQYLGILDKPGIKFWVAELVAAGFNWQEQLKIEGRRGHVSHQMALDLLLGKRRSLSSLEPEHRPYGQAVMAWLLKRQPEVIAAERMVASIEHRFSGRFDLHAKLRGIPGSGRIDFKSKRKWPEDNKTGKRRPPYATEVMQLDMYEGGARESGYEEADYGMVVRLGPDGTFDETPFLLDPDRPRNLIAVDADLASAENAMAVGLETPELAVAA